MKTIKAFLIGIFTLVLSVASLVYSVAILTNSTTIYYQYNQTEPTTFTTMFVAVSIFLFAVGLQLLLFSVGAFKRFSKYHDNYLLAKRDRQIKNQYLTETYSQLYKDLADAPNLEIKEAILKTFYEEEHTNDNPLNFEEFLNALKQR